MPGLLSATKRNLDRGQSSIRLFELGQRYLSDAEQPLVEYFRNISGEHPDWDEYRQAMLDQDKSILRITPKPDGTYGSPAGNLFTIADSRSSVGASPVWRISASWVLRQLSLIRGGLPLLSWISR